MDLIRDFSHILNRKHNQSILFLIAGALIGVAMSVAGLMESRESHLIADEIAKVNKSSISSQKYQTLVDGFARDRKRPTAKKDRDLILERMIEEELLVQRGVELGLLESDAVVRSSVVRSMIQSIIEEASSRPFSEIDLRAFYRQNTDFFTVPFRLRLRRIVIKQFNQAGIPDPPDSDSAYQKAMKAYRAMSGGMAFSTAMRRYGDIQKFDLPNVLLPPAKIQEYIGPSLTRHALTMATGEISLPLKTNTGYCILHLLDRINTSQQTFEKIRPQVEAEFRKRRDDQALRDYLERLKQGAVILRGIDNRGGSR